jgi:hypothetical protein
LLALFVLACFGAAATFFSSARPPGFQGPMFVVLGLALLSQAVRGFVRRREGARCPTSSIWKAGLGGAALILAIPPLLSLGLPRRVPVPPILATTQQVCWWAGGLLLAVSFYVFFSRHDSASEPRSP